MSARRILIVEDSSTMRGLLTFALRRQLPDAEIVEAENGRVGLDLLGKSKFDIVLLDINMPVLGGFGFLEKVGHTPDRPPIVVVTTEGAEEDIARAMSLGASAYVTKPIKAPDMAKTIARVLGV